MLGGNTEPRFAESQAAFHREYSGIERRRFFREKTKLLRTVNMARANSVPVNVNSKRM